MATITKKNPVEKITYAQAFNAVLDILNGMDADEVLTTVSVGKETDVPLTVATAIERVQKQIEKLNQKHSSKSSKLTETQKANISIGEIVLDFLREHSGEQYTVADLLKNVPGLPDEMVSAKMTAILRMATVQPFIGWEEIKGRRYYRYSPTTEELGE